MASDFILEVNESDFDYEVISFSYNTPVVAEFWAEWSHPCKPLTETLERLAKESQGGFRLAMVNSDQNPNLAIRFGVRTLPTVIAFSGGEVVSEFAGAIPEERVREFIAQIRPPSPAALIIARGDSLISAEAWAQAEQAYREGLEMDPDNPAGLLGLAKSLLAQGKSHEAMAILTSYPSNRLYARAQALLPLAEAIARLRDFPLEADLDERQAAYWNAVRLVTRGKVKPALDGLLDLLRADKNDQAARRLVLAILELMGDDNPATREYRRELSTILF
jgi:putative thioredoxin